MTQCYNCGKYFEDKEITAEHIPAKNLYIGFNEDYKKQRLTVKGCFACNNNYSKIDQEIRDAIGIMNEDNESQKELTEKAVRSILRRHDGKARLEFSNSGKVMSVSFDYWKLVELHKKHFKALFYDRYREALDDKKFGIQVICEGDEDDPKAMSVFGNMYQYLISNGDWSVSGHEDIFQYRIKSISDNGRREMVDTINLKNAIGVVAVMVYHKNLCAVVIAMRIDYMEALENKRQKK